MKSSPTLRVFMAAGMYLLLMWGYVALQTPQLFAVLAALIMCIALIFWVNGSHKAQNLPDIQMSDAAHQPVDKRSGDEFEPTLSASMSKLDSLKDELTEQYAQFGKDQSILNSKGLGTWQQKYGCDGEDEE